MKAKITVVGQPQSRSIIANALRGGNDVERKEVCNTYMYKYRTKEDARAALRVAWSELKEDAGTLDGCDIRRGVLVYDAGRAVIE